ncbi:hypothetical protein O1M54_15365 [Streptomyces diastatochromogenes]|nr:hypothetical protein [Streptomyces diastatochromogenes]
MDINHLPAGITIPAAVTKAQAALDKLWDAYGDAQIEYADALGEGWQERAQARDAAAAKAAVLAGKPAPKSTEIARVTAMRGTALGVIEAYEQQIRAAGAVVHRAWAASMPEVREQVVSALKAAESDYDEAVNRFTRPVALSAVPSLRWLLSTTWSAGDPVMRLHSPSGTPTTSRLFSSAVPGSLTIA